MLPNVGRPLRPGRAIAESRGECGAPIAAQYQLLLQPKENHPYPNCTKIHRDMLSTIKKFFDQHMQPSAPSAEDLLHVSRPAQIAARERALRALGREAL